ncbi:secretoglobin family 1D member 2 [Struthio camelus]|uniref:secretoglobin family 1D member 2 n=1 Tax=Struthio camelus TaxID=8801 RepID=UPI003603E0DC
MRPALLLVLATLAVFCHTATALACPEIWNLATKFLYGSVEEYVDAVSPYTTTPVMKAAELQLKQCVQESVTNKQTLTLLVSQILSKC